MPKGGARPGAGRKPRPVISLREARRRKEAALCRLRELELAQKEGRLLDADAVGRTWCAMMRDIQTSILAVPSRLRQQLLHLSARDIQVIDRELRDALAALAARQGEDDGGGGARDNSDHAA